METAFNTIAFTAAKCDGCGDCMIACATAKTGTGDPSRARLAIIPGSGDARHELALCRQCATPRCVMVCPAGALAKDGTTGIVGWDADRCVDCLLCTAGCAFAGISVDGASARVAKCDLCDGDPACTRSCTTGALEFVRSADIYTAYGDQEDLFVPGLSACQGCNSELMIRHTMRRVGRNSILATPPGCIAGMGTVGYNGKTGTKVPVFHPLLTNSAGMLSGIRRYYDRIGRKGITVMSLAGDGGTVDAGFSSLSGAAERGEKILYICVDNEGYMNTGMQRSGSTPYGSWTSTTPVGDSLKGKTSEAKDMPSIMVAHRAAYVATASLAFMDDYYAKLDKAIEASLRGLAYLHLYSPCPTGWRFPSSLTIEVCRKSVESNFVTLWEYTPAEGLRFTRSPEHPVPVVDYLKMIGKYRHLSEEQAGAIQAMVDRRVALLKRTALADDPAG